MEQLERKSPCMFKMISYESHLVLVKTIFRCDGNSWVGVFASQQIFGGQLGGGSVDQLIRKRWHLHGNISWKVFL